MITIRHLQHGNITELTPHDLPADMDGADGRFWIDLEAASPEEEERILVNWLKVEPSAVADVRAGRERLGPLPKVEQREDKLLVILDTLELAEPASHADSIPRVRVGQLSILLTDKVMITHHYRPLEGVSEMLQDEPTIGRMLANGPASLFHGVLDKLLDRSIPLLLQVDETIERMDDMIQETPDLKYLADIKLLKKEVGPLRRTAHYQRELTHRLAHREFPLISTAEREQLRSVHDRTVRLSDLADSYHDAVNGLMDEHLNLRSQNLNEVMKLLTMISTIFLPLSVITGFYGMNLAYLPWAGSIYSFVAVTAVMVLIAGVMLYRFRRKGWL